MLSLPILRATKALCFKPVHLSLHACMSLCNCAYVHVCQQKHSSICLPLTSSICYFLLVTERCRVLSVDVIVLFLFLFLCWFAAVKFCRGCWRNVWVQSWTHITVQLLPLHTYFVLFINCTPTHLQSGWYSFFPHLFILSHSYILHKRYCNKTILSLIYSRKSLVVT